MAYITLADLHDVFGSENITQWADLNNNANQSEITARIARAIAWATNEIDSRLRGSAYVLPLANDSGSVPLEIVDAAANLAGVWLYENRGVQDANPETGTAFHRLEWNRMRAEKVLREIIAGVRVLDAVKHDVSSAIPKIIPNG